MDKGQFYQYFWSQFEWKAYDESTVPEKEDGTIDVAKLPYITYMEVEDEFESPIYPNASLWDYGTSWLRISQKANEISEAIGLGGKVYEIDNGRVWVQRGHPFAQRVRDDNDMVRRIILNIELEFMTNK